jgi:hypothetical protein
MNLLPVYLPMCHPVYPPPPMTTHHDHSTLLLPRCDGASVPPHHPLPLSVPCGPTHPIPLCGLCPTIHRRSFLPFPPTPAVWLQSSVSKLSHLLSDMTGRRVVLMIVTIVGLLGLLDASVEQRKDTHLDLPRVGLAALHRFALDTGVSNGTFNAFLLDFDKQVGDLL